MIRLALPYQPRRAWGNGVRKPAKHTRNACERSGRASAGGGATAVVKAAPTIAIARPVKPAQAEGDVLAAIDEVIAAKQADVQTLERAKEILTRG